MNAFQPTGGTARWRLLYSMLAPCAPGDVLTYADMCEELGVPESSRHIVQSAIRRAAKEFEERDRHALESVPNVGYRVVEAQEHVTLAREQQQRAGRALQRGHSKVTNVDLSGLDTEARRAVLVIAQALSMQIDFNRRLDVRQKDLERQTELITERTDRTEEEITELKERLARLEYRG